MIKMAAKLIKFNDIGMCLLLFKNVNGQIRSFNNSTKHTCCRLLSLINVN